MTPRTALNRAVLILLAAFLLVATTWVTRMDEQVASVSLEQYCRDAAIWAAEEARGVPIEQRAGQPDWENKAADVCPGMRPAQPAYQVASPGDFPATQPQRQLVQF